MSIDEICLKFALPSSSLESSHQKEYEDSMRKTAGGYKKDFENWLSFNAANCKNVGTGENEWWKVLKNALL